MILVMGVYQQKCIMSLTLRRSARSKLTSSVTLYPTNGPNRPERKCIAVSEARVEAPVSASKPAGLFKGGAASHLPK